MSRRVVVTANCHTGGVTAALAAMLPDDEVVPVPGAAAGELAGADVWVVAGERDTWAGTAASVPGLRALALPDLWFDAFHPDLLHVVHPDGGWVRSPLDEYHSAIVLWGWRRGLGSEAIAALFRPQVFLDLGYTTRWGRAVAILRERFLRSDLSFDEWFLAVRRTGAFMLGDNHPRLTALVQLARPVARALGADPDRIAFPWETTLPDALLTVGAVWPLYPGIAEPLGLRGGLLWKAPGGALLDLQAFVAGSLAAYDGLDPHRLDVPALTLPTYDEVLSRG